MKTSLQQAVLFQALGHPQRLQILKILASGPVCVCDLTRLTGRRQPYISQQLTRLSKAHLVTAERFGRSILYRLNSGEVEEAMNALHPLCPSTKSLKERNNSHV
jgi:DNA-binding transcriptional ArsR family regulator